LSARVETPARVLIVDDDEAHAEALADGLAGEDYECVVAGSGEAGIREMRNQSFDVVLTDLVMTDLSGLDVLRESRVLLPEAPVLLITGHATIRTAVDAMREGAEDYLAKPVDIVELRNRVERAIEKSRLRHANAELLRVNQELRRQIDKRHGFEGILGHSPQMQRLFEILGQVASSNATILVLGESGTGKELVARAIHTNSPRVDENFVAVNCAALSEGLIESELFGHVKGAFTGAVGNKEGRIVYADRGTLFLDEVGDMPLATQAKLLRALETREVVPVGGNKAQPVDVRLVAATNRDLRQMVSEEKFREDLLFRLQVVTLELPPLRQRVGDIPLLIEHFIGELSRAHDRLVRGITPEARALLVRYDWPGNVRDLRNAIENMVLLARGELLTVDDVPETVKRTDGRQNTHGGGMDLAGRSLQEIERAAIIETLRLMDGNRQKTAKVLGIGERTLYRKIKEYGL
jgi:two-component system response regulator HydG